MMYRECENCGASLDPGDKFHEHRGVVVCSFFLEELNESEEFVE